MRKQLCVACVVVGLSAGAVAKTVPADSLWNVSGSFGKAEGSAAERSGGYALKGNGYRLETSETTDANGVTHRRTVLTNVSQDPLSARCLLDRFVLNGSYDEVYTQANTWQNESRSGWSRLVTGVEVRGDGLASARGAAPMLAVWDPVARRGRVYHLVADSAWEMHAQAYDAGGDRTGVRVEVGVSGRHLDWQLKPGEALALPEVLYHGFSERADFDAWKLHAWWNRTYPGRAPASIYNSWLCRFDKLEPDFVLKQIAVAKELGLAYFVLDAGWFGQKGNWWQLRGDWEERQDGALEGRMGEIAAAAKKAGMKFGFWLESESADAGSQTVKDHPDWFCRNGHGYLYDFANPAARDAMIARTVALVKKYDAGFIKQDFNQNTEYDPSGRAFADYHAGFDAYLKAVRAQCPDLYIDGCASGGMRTDLGRARQFDGFWLSDNQSPYDGIRIVKETLFRLPPRLVERWVVARSLVGVQPHYDGSDARIAACDDAMWDRLVTVKKPYLAAFTAGGAFCLSCDLTAFSAEDRAWLKKLIAARKADGVFWQKAVARVVCDTREVTAIQYSDEALSDIRLEVSVGRPRCAQLTIRPVVDAGKSYRFGGAVLSGAQVAQHGLEIATPGNHDAVELRLVAVADGSAK